MRHPPPEFGSWPIFDWVDQCPMEPFISNFMARWINAARAEYIYFFPEHHSGSVEN